MTRVKRQKSAKKSDRSLGTDASGIRPLSTETQKGIVIVGLFALAGLSLLSFFDFAGPLGAGFNRALSWVFGWGRFVVPVIAAVLGYLLIYPDRYSVRRSNYIGLILLLFSGLGLLHLALQPELVAGAIQGRGGGFLGLVLSWPAVRGLGVWGSGIVLFALVMISLLVVFNTSMQTLLVRFPASGFIGRRRDWLRQGWISYRHHRQQRALEADGSDVDEDLVPLSDAEVSFARRELAPGDQAQPTDTPKQLELMPVKTARNRQPKIDFPLHLLNLPSETPTSGDIEANKEKIHQALKNFGIDVEMAEVNVGPTVTQYTLRPAEGVKLSQITTLQNDISLTLAAHPIRLEAPIPGKALVGIEVPNKAVAKVTLREILEAKEFRRRKDNLILPFGRDVAGHPFFYSLQKMPHLLIAGATGSGKSVCINTILVSLMAENSPDDMKFILVDPKRVELTSYNQVPYLLTPVVTEVDKTVNALRWSVAEMDRRYQTLSEEGVRNIESYNEQRADKMPYIVLVIDELADLMAAAANEVEAAIVRLAQMSRAIGIHLVLATQRPSVNVLTGLIKANMPARAAFAVTSQVDSRTILDMSGAEKLLGRGDMLFVSSELSKPKRLQGAFLSDAEIERVCQYLATQAAPSFDTEVVNKQAGGVLPQAFQDGESEDNLVDEAKQVILQSGKASASLLQRRLRVGYARAARILDILEEQGFIGPGEGAKPREILAAGSQASDSEIDSETDFSDTESHRDVT